MVKCNMRKSHFNCSCQNSGEKNKNKRLLDKGEYDVKNYMDQRGCYLSKLKIKVDNNL